MSTTPETRWSRVGSQTRQNPTSTSNSRDRASNPPQPRNNTSNPPRTNAWAAGRSNTPTTAATPAAPASPAVMPAATEEKYTPVGGFNAEEVKEYMKKTYQDAIAGDTNNTARYKCEDGAAKAGGPWGQKPSNMANGQAFWVQLQKQIASHQQGG